MFSTFTSDLSPANSRSKQAASTPRPKRAQVAHACNWCRTNRVKCDDDVPCAQCRQRGGQCSNSSKLASSASLLAANSDNQRLRDRIKDLETQLKQGADNTKSGPGEKQTHVGSQSSRAKLPDKPRRTSDGAGLEPILYGPLSLPYLVVRLQHYLRRALPRSALDLSLEQIADPTSNVAPFPQLEEIHPLSRIQEESFLYLLWESFHPVYPILSSKQFHLYYDSLWVGSTEGHSRQPSALVDSLLAVCTQYCSTFTHAAETEFDNVGTLQDTAAAWVGHSYYLRSQALLMGELEAPSLMSLQAFIYCIIYLYHSSLLNTAYSILGIAVRVAQTLRLHLHFSNTSPEEQDLRARIWWTLYQLDITISMSLDRPTLIHLEDVGCSLPVDKDQSLHLSNDTMLQSTAHPDISWISFHVQSVRLATTVRGVHDVLKEQCTRMMQESDVLDIYDNPTGLENLAIMLERESHAVKDWVRAVPKSLKASRQGEGDAFSTDRVKLSLDSASPLWLQRQRLLLELAYHDLQLSIFRPFLRLIPKTLSLMPHTDYMGMNALNHALALTNLLHQVLSETDILRGWLPGFRLQWNSVICILAFVVGNPVSTFASTARKGLQTAVKSLEIMGHYHPAAHGAVHILRKIIGLSEVLTAEFRGNVNPHRSPTPKTSPTHSQYNSQSVQVVNCSSEPPLFGPPLDSLPCLETSMDMSQHMLTSAFDMNFLFSPLQSESSRMAQMIPSNTISQGIQDPAMGMDYWLEN